MKRKLLNAVLFGSLLSTGSAYAGNASLALQVKSTIEVGTCTAEIYDGSTKTNTIGMGSVPVSQVLRPSTGKSFSLRFRDCSGLPNSKALLKIQKRAGGCAGGDSNQETFANSSAETAKAGATALELWPGAVDTGTKFNCNNPASTEQTISLPANTATTPYSYPLSARLVKPTGKADSDVTAGAFLGETTFIISYN